MHCQTRWKKDVIGCVYRRDGMTHHPTLLVNREIVEEILEDGPSAFSGGIHTARTKSHDAEVPRAHS
eukprot:53420-Eustigmatos_ZCMA.PRE.1